MTDRDTFAAAALTGLLANKHEHRLPEEFCRMAFEWANLMLRERLRNGSVEGCETTEGQFDRSEPIENGPAADSRVWETPAKTNPTPPRSGTPTEGSVQGEGSVPNSRTENEPVAWWIRGVEYDTGCEYEYVSLVKESADEAAREGGTAVPLYRSPALTKKEQKAVAFAAKHFGAFKNQAATLRALLERLG